MSDLEVRNLRKYGLRRGAYDGARKRRFVLFESLHNGNELRREFDTARERDAKCRERLEAIKQVANLIGAN